ncbi:hydroxymethylbilane synthase [Pseudarthrobacter sp. P1]|uniref:hydroxymethylbilane synthase n=1 Tax=Pseudarthrobacter sp. P1 TaxID=3418418 RepID=UPI003CE87A72
MQSVKVGTRGSKLALTQTRQTAEKLAAVGGFGIELVEIKTEGDILTGPLSQMGGTGVFATALRQAVLDGRADIAVHSLKDLPTAAALGLSIAAIPAREDARDVLCSRDGLSFADLPTGAKVGTGSPRRAAQLLAARPDLSVVDIRGNVDTRLGRVPGLPGNAADAVVPGKTGDLDAVVLAASGLARIGRLDTVAEYFESDVMLPAPGQGALAVECRTEDAPNNIAAGTPGLLGQALAALDDVDTRLSVTAERALLARLEAGCSAPVGALAYRKGSMLYLDAVVCSLDGTKVLRKKKATDGLTEVGATLLGIDLAEELLADGAGDLADLAGSGK